MVPALLRPGVPAVLERVGDIDVRRQVSGVALPLAAVLALHAGAAQMGY